MKVEYTLLPLLPTTVSAWGPALPALPPSLPTSSHMSGAAIEKTVGSATREKSNLECRHSIASFFSATRMKAYCQNHRLSTVVPLERPKHRGAQKVLNLSAVFGPDGPQPEDVVQGDSGDCYLLALLAAMAEHQPEQLLDALAATDASKTSYRFRHYQPGSGHPCDSIVYDTAYVDNNHQPLYATDRDRLPTTETTALTFTQKEKKSTIENPQGDSSDVTPSIQDQSVDPKSDTVTQQKSAASSRSLQGVLSPKKVSWVKLYENWFAQMNERYALLNNKPGFYGISHSGWAAIPFQLLTGKDMDIIAPKNLSHFSGLMEKAQAGKIVVLISKTNTFSEYYFPATHAYAVLGHTPKETELYNPHGRRLTLSDKMLFDNTIRVLVETDSTSPN